MWFDLLKWLSEQEDATTVAELQERLEQLTQFTVTAVYYPFYAIVPILIALGVSLWYTIGLEKRIKKLEAALLEKKS